MASVSGPFGRNSRCMAAVLHQVGIVQLVIRGGLLEQRLDDLTVGIVD